MPNRVWKQSNAEKGTYVKGLFSALAKRYNPMTDLWTFGLHRLWKKRAIVLCQFQPGESVLDVATGTGDLLVPAVKLVGSTGKVLGIDFCPDMLKVAEQRTGGTIPFQEGDATQLEVEDESYDVVMIGFGLRNVGNQQKALSEFYRVLKPGGRLMVLDFSRPSSLLFRLIHDGFFYVIMPTVGWAVAWHKNAHHYTADSMRSWASKDQLTTMIQDANFNNVSYTSMTGGLGAVHLGYKT